jgi:putative ABC transport system permease protein
VVDLAFKSLLHDRLRFAITVCGVAFAVLLVFVQVGLFRGLLSNASVMIEHLDADLWVTSRNNPNIDFAQSFPETYVQRVRSIEGVERADNLIVWFTQVSLPNGAQEGAQVYALEDFSRWRIPWTVNEGDVEDLRRGRFVLLDDSAKKRFGEFHAGEFREVLSNRLKILGTTHDAKSFTTTPVMFMDYHLAQSIHELLAGRTTYVLIKLAKGADPAAVRAEIQRRLPYNDVYTGAEWAARSKRYWVESTGLGLNMFLTVFLGCLVGIVVVAQTLYTSTMEHLKEFGTVKAIGGTNADIYSILAKQATVAAIVGFALGAAGAYLLAPVVERVDLKLILTPDLFVAVLLGSLVFCLGAALISFRKVASIDPALVFRT